VAAPKGNKFWERRTTHGRKALFSDPSALWAGACEYFTFCEENPLDSVEYNGKNAVECIVPKMRAFTVIGLCLYLGVNSKYFNEFKERLADTSKPVKKRSEFRDVITNIEETIYQQKFEGAAAGLLNGNLISRELGLVDKKASQVDGTIDLTNTKIEVTVKNSGVQFGNSPTDG
jgi:hypothetical protein